MAVLAETPVQLVGDGRCDSPGFSARYCTCSAMDSTSGSVVSFSFRHVAPSNSSVATQKNGCRDVLRELLDHEANIEVFATDRNSQVISILKEDGFHHINDQFDVFHLAETFPRDLLSRQRRAVVRS